MNTQNMHIRPASQRGFSLIEAMVAVVVLATGLLALAALQGTLTRSAADSRTRSQIAAAVESIAEAQRSSAFAAIDGGAVATTDYVVPGASNFQVSSTCQYVNLTTGVNGACAGQGAVAREAQYKRMTYIATWTDAAGSSRQLSVVNIVSPRTLTTSNNPYEAPTTGPNRVPPTVRTTNPAVDGMIPIAIGDNTDTAATNPKPNIVSGNVIRTSYEVLTYQNEQDSNYVKQQRRVETAVIGCTCRRNAAPTGAQFERAQWPAYWNGNRFAIYDSTAPAPGTAAATGPVADAIQDNLCTECCRDHHDVSGTTDVKYDPYRSDAHTHYKLNGSVLEVAGASDDYLEVCRMVRVDGFWRTAQDLDSKHFALLATQNTARSPVPQSTAVTSYEDFVIDFLKFNYLPGQTPQTAANLYEGRGLNAPSRIEIGRPQPADERYLHARGLYVDKVEPVAQEKITRAAQSCTRTNAVECILPLLSFTSINLTEAAFWRPQDTGVLSVHTDGFVLFNPQSPNRGRVNALSTAAADRITNIIPYIQKSNSGVAVRARGIDPDDDVDVEDMQEFKVLSGASSATGFNFAVALTNLGTANKTPAVAWRIGATEDNCQGQGNNTYNCAVSVTAGATSIIVSGYNKQVDRKQDVTVTCPGSTSSATYSPSGQKTARFCQNYRVASALLGSSPANTIQNPPTNTGRVGSQSSGVGSESTQVDFGTVSGGQSVTIDFAFEGETVAPINSCTFKSNGTLDGVAFGDCP